MKTNLYSLALSMCLSIGLITVFSNCQPLVDVRILEITYQGHDTVFFKAGATAGVYAYSENTIKNNVELFLRERGIDKNKIVNLKFDSTVVTIPSNSTLDFDALDEGVFTLKGLSTASGGAIDSLNVKFPKTTGKVATFKQSFHRDVRPLILNADRFQYSASLKTNRPTPATNMDVKYSFTIGYLMQ